MSSGLIVAMLAGFRRSVLVVVCAPAAVFGQALAPPVRLALDQIGTATQRAEEPVIYLFAARAGTGYLIDVEQSGLDFVVSVESPDGRAQSYNSPLKRDEREYALLEAAANGDYRITVVSNESTHAIGRHAIKVVELDAITEGNEARARAWRAMTSGATVNAAADHARLTQTLTQEQVDAMKESSFRAYAGAAAAWQELGELRLHAQALYSMAMLEYWDLYDWASAAEVAEQAAQVYRNVDDDLRVRAELLRAYALVDAAGEMDRDAASAAFDAALARFADAAARYEQRGDLRAHAEVSNFVGYTHQLRGNYAAAEPSWQRAASLFAQLGEWGDELVVRQNLAVLETEQGRLGKAIETFRYVLTQIPAGKNPDLEASVLENLGAVNRDFGEIDEALRAYSRALALRRDLGDSTHLSVALRGLGSTYYVSGEHERAKIFLEQALAAAREVRDGRSQAAVLTYLGNIAYLERDHDAALRLHRDAERLTNSTLDQGARRLLIAKDLAASGNHREALVQAENVAAASGDFPVVLADAHAQIGRSHVAGGDFAAAHEHLQRALSIYRSLHLQEGEAEALHDLAVAAHGAGRVDDALAYGEAALDRIENLRVKVSAPELRALYSAAQRGFYETQIDLLMQNGAHASEPALLAALSVSERARARMLVDLLAAARVDSRLDENVSGTAHKNRLQDELAALGRRRDRMLGSPLADGQANEELGAVLREIAELENELTLLGVRARIGSELAPATVLTGQDIQRAIDPGSVLLQYHLGERHSYVWIVAHDSIRALELPARDEIEAAARDALGSLQTSTSSPAQRNTALKALSERVLTPLAQLIGGRRVIVAADGALHYVPFSVLPVVHDGQDVALIATHEVVSVPSISAVTAQRTRRAAPPAGQTLAIFADPVFERTDERLRRAGASAPEPRGDAVTRSSLELRRLPYSGREARDIAALVPRNAMLLAEGFSATRAQLLQADLRPYRYLHFATHGLVDARNPALSALALSQFDRDGNPLAGFVRLDDIYGLQLRSDLVVLSACDTALGREIRGEGLVGLAQAFLYAGTKNLILSLWQVSDAATAVLMTRFYEQLLGEGASPAEALRKAQLSMSADRRWADPYYWSSFVLLGDFD